MCDAYNLLILLVRLRSIVYRQLVNYCFIIQLDDCMCSFGCVDDFIMIVTFPVKLVNNKLVGNLLILLVQKFHSYRLNGLRFIAVRILLLDLLVLWADVED